MKKFLSGYVAYGGFSLRILDAHLTMMLLFHTWLISKNFVWFCFNNIIQLGDLFKSFLPKQAKSDNNSSDVVFLGKKDAQEISGKVKANESVTTHPVELAATQDQSATSLLQKIEEESLLLAKEKQKMNEAIAQFEQEKKKYAQTQQQNKHSDTENEEGSQTPLTASVETPTKFPTGPKTKRSPRSSAISSTAKRVKISPKTVGLKTNQQIQNQISMLQLELAMDDTNEKYVRHK
jgi:hypothetical protein